MKIRRPLRKTVRLVCLLLFLAGCAAFVAMSAGEGAAGRAAPPSATRAVTNTMPATSLTPQPPCRALGLRVQPSNTKEAPARTPIPPGKARKTATPTRKHLPPGLAKKTPTATPTAVGQWTGSVLINGGVCCVGGCVGQVVNLNVEFSASSPYGKVTEMRVPSWESGDWEPFTSFKRYPWTIVVNWVGLQVNAQFRDEYGNVSPVYCDDIVQEGWCAFTGTP
ncbi:MAG: hypothetical protein ACM3QS_11640 [Bacteroidota bacterium]